MEHGQRSEDILQDHTPSLNKISNTCIKKTGNSNKNLLTSKLTNNTSAIGLQHRQNLSRTVYRMHGMN